MNDRVYLHVFRSVPVAGVLLSLLFDGVLVVAHLPIASHELAGARSPRRWVAVEVLTARNFCLRVNR